MNRRNAVLSVLLAAQLMLVLLIYWPQQQGSASVITLLNIDPAQVDSMVISDGYGSSITIKKQGDAYVIDPPESYPADASRVKSALKKLCHLVSHRLVSTSMGSQGRLRVSDERFNRRIKLVDSAGKAHVIYLGTTQGKGVYARAGDSDKVVFVSAISSWEFVTSPRSWWKTTLVDITPGAVNSLELKNSHGTFVIKRNSDDRWIDGAGKLLDQDKVKQLLLAVQNIRLSEYLKKDTGRKLEKVDASLKISTGRGKHISIEIGPEKNSERIVRTNVDPHLVKVRSFELKQVLNATLSGLMPQKAPEKKAENRPANGVKKQQVPARDKVVPDDAHGATAGAVAGSEAESGAGHEAKVKAKGK